MAEKLAIAAIGAGRIAQQHLAVLSDLPEAAVTTLVDPNQKALKETAQRLGIPIKMDWFAPGGYRVDVRSVGATFMSNIGQTAHIRYRDGRREQLELDDLD
jgi:hypothetical protein